MIENDTSDKTNQPGSIESLYQEVATAQASGCDELIYSLPTGETLFVFVNGNRAWLLYLRHQYGDTGFSIRNPKYKGPAEATLDFRLGEGEVEYYPYSWTVLLASALGAVQYFLTEGGMAPWLSWHDEAAVEENGQKVMTGGNRATEDDKSL